MPQLNLQLLGSFQVSVAGEPVSAFPTSKVRALLAFLALEADRPHERALLASLLWPDETPEKSLANLRQGLHRLEHACDGVGLAAPLLRSSRHAVQLNPALAWSSDAGQLLGAVAAARAHPHRRLSVCGACIGALREAAALYRGELLAGFSVGRSLPFDEWLSLRRDQLREACAWALASLAAYHEQRGEGEAARDALRRWLELEPWHEEAHQRLIMSLARDGQRAAALAQFERCRQRLARDLGAEPWTETVALVSRARSGLLDVGAAPPFSVPAAEPPMVAREAELAAISAHLASPHGRLLTLTGPGGSGKTRIALAAATEARGGFADGIFFVALAAVTTPAGMLAAVVAALGLLVQRQDADPATMLRDYLRERELLLVLDNCEQLLAGAALLADLLACAPGLRLLVTSRAPLRLAAEEVLAVDGLALPPLRAMDVGCGADAPALDQVPAVRLFLQVARRAAPGFAPDAEDLGAIAAICHAVDGLPLALLMAAGLVTRRAPAAILTLLQQNLDLLTSDWRGMPERHQSVRALFASSHLLVGAAERHVLAHCALFAGPFSREAVAAVGGEGLACMALPLPCELQAGHCRYQPAQCGTAQALETLAEHALLQRHGPGRYALHPLVRQFVAETFATLPLAEQAAGQARHRSFFLSLLSHMADQITGPDGRAAVERLRDAVGDIYVAWQTAVEADDYALIAATIPGFRKVARIGAIHSTRAIALSAAIERFRTRDGAAVRSLLVRLLVLQAEAAYTWGDYQALISSAADASALADAQGLALEAAEARLAWGKGLWRLGDQAGARAQLRRAAASLRGEGAGRVGQQLRSDIHYYQGMIDWVQGAFGPARAHYTAALRIAPAAASYGETFYHTLGGGAGAQRSTRAAVSYGEGDALNTLALLALTQGAYREAIAHGGAARAIYQASGNQAGESLALISLGLAHMYCWEDLAAQEVFETSQHRCAQTGDRQSASLAALLGGILLTRVGAYDEAHAALDESLARCRELNHRWGLSFGLAYQGLLRHLVGDQAGAAASCREALGLVEQLGDPMLDTYAATNLGHALAALDRPAEARAYYERAATFRQLIGQSHLAPEPLAGLARLALVRGDLAGALAHVEAILAIGDATGLAGTDEPARIAVVCHAVLSAAGDPRAGAVVAAGARRLAERAERLAGSELRQRLTQAVAANVSLLTLAGRPL